MQVCLQVSNKIANCNKALMNPAEYGIAIAVVNGLPYRVEILEANDDRKTFLVRFVDSGEESIVERSQLYEVDDENKVRILKVLK